MALVNIAPLVVVTGQLAGHYLEQLTSQNVSIGDALEYTDSMNTDIHIHTATLAVVIVHAASLEINNARA